MTRRISAVAVCCSSASLVSLNRRAFSIAITAWSAKVVQQGDLLVGERAGVLARRRRSRRCPPSAEHRHDQHRRDSRPAAATRACDVVGVSERVDDRAPACRVAGRTRPITVPRSERTGESGDMRLDLARRRVVAPHASMHLARRSLKTPPCCRANSRSQLSRDRVEHRLRVGDRAADDAQHLGGRGLLLERLLGLVEQARVLDRDHRLVGEGLQQRDRPCRRTARLLARRRRSTPMPRPSRSIGTPPRAEAAPRAVGAALGA